MSIPETDGWVSRCFENVGQAEIIIVHAAAKWGTRSVDDSLIVAGGKITKIRFWHGGVIAQ